MKTPSLANIAIVVQRWHPGIVGGSEALAWQYAQLLREDFAVELLTSTAKDYVTWNNELAAGRERHDGVDVVRFPVAFPRSPYWHELHRRLLDRVARNASAEPMQRIGWRAPLQEEFVRMQGPHCPELIEHLGRHHSAYAAIIFCTYLYPTAYFGAGAVPAAKRIFVPTLHDEPPACLEIFRERAEQAAEIIWLSAAERDNARKLWGIERGDVVGMAVDTTPAVPEKRREPYLLYCGRIDESKGCKLMLDAFLAYKKRDRSALKLVLTGSDHLGVPKHPDIEFLGFVPGKRKAALMAGACALIQPSPFESFSIVLLEAMAQRAPVLANGQCNVLREHVEQSGGGFVFDGERGLSELIARIVKLGSDERMRIGKAGRDYVVARFAEQRVRAALRTTIDRIVRPETQRPNASGGTGSPPSNQPGKKRASKRAPPNTRERSTTKSPP
ncbi:MAG: glycosyltransferase family 4 protein [Dokdonella sp.]